MKRYFHMLKEEFKGYNKRTFRNDLFAGITVAAVALPLAIAFGVASGVDAAAGLITAVIAGIVIGGLSGGFYQISGPTGAMAVVLMSVAATQGINGILLATFIAGALLLAAGIFKLGNLISFIPAPVITGFTSGIAIIIALGQVDNLFGSHSHGHSTLEKLASYQEGFSIQPVAVGLGIFVMAMMVFYPKKWNQKLPASLLAIIITTILVSVLDLPVAKVGEIPSSIIGKNRLTLGGMDLTSMKNVFFPAVSIAALGMIESLLCGASAGRMTNKTLDSNQELVAQGVGNMLLPFFGGIPATAAIARTSVAIKSGAATRLAGIIHALVLLLSTLVLAPIMSQIPMPALAGVLMITAWRMNEWETIKSLIEQRHLTGCLLFFITMISTVIFDLSLAIVIGIIASCIFFILKSARISISVEPIEWQRMNLPETAETKDWSVVYITGPLFFMSAEQLKQTLQTLENKQGIIFSMRGVPNIDLTALDILAEFQHKMKSRGNQVIFASLQPEVQKYIGTIDSDNQKQHFSVVQVLHELHGQQVYS